MRIMKRVQRSLPGARGRWRGHIDGVLDGIVTGWAMDELAPTASVEVAATAASGRRIVAVADTYRDDLERAGHGNGRHGFRLDLSAWSAADGTIDVSIVGSKRSLNAQPLTIAGFVGGPVGHGGGRNESHWRGHVDSFDRNFVRGWAIDTANPHRRLVVEAVSRAGHRIAGIAERYRGDLLGLGYGDGCHSFEIDISAFTQADCPIEVVVDRGRHRINRQPLDFDVMTMLTGFEPPAAVRLLFEAAAQAVLADRSVDVAPPPLDTADGADATVSRASAVLFDTAAPAADPEGFVSKFTRYESFRCERERHALAMTGDLPDRVGVAMWYVVDYLRIRQHRFVPPLSRAQQRALNGPVPLAGYPAEVTVALLNVVEAEMPEYGNLRDPAVLRAALYWWCCIRTPRDKLDASLVTGAMATFLMREDRHAGEPFPLTVFMVEYFEAHPELHALQLTQVLDRAVYMIYLVTKSFTEPFIARLLTRDALRVILAARQGAVRYDEALSHLAGQGGYDGTAVRHKGEALLALHDLDLRRAASFELRDRGECLLRRRSYPATAEEGVALIGPLHKTSGLGQAMRLSADTLRVCEAKPPTTLVFDLDNPAPVGFASTQAYKPFERPREINLLHLNAEFIPFAFAFEQQEIFAKSYNIGYFFWELNAIPKCQHLALELLDEIWVSSEYGRQIYAQHTDKPVINVGMAVEPPPEVEPVDRATFGLQPNATIFLTTFDSFSFIERKNPMGVLDAFRTAFPRGDEAVQLVLKTQNRGRVTDAYQVDLWRRIDRVAGADPRIIIINETLSYRDILALKLACDCYVSLHRSEGWGFGMLEAMNLGRPVIATGYSGNMDFCAPETTYLVDYELVGVREAEYLYVERGSVWAQPHLGQAAECMRDVANDPAAASARGAAGAAHVKLNFSVEAVARRYGARIKEIRSMRKPT